MEMKIVNGRRHGVRHTAKMRERASQMRLSGMSLGEISRRMSISKGTASLWLRSLEVHAPREGYSNRRTYRNSGRAIRKIAKQRRVFWLSEATKTWNAHATNSLFSVGVGLYWGEGRKTGGAFSIANTDPSAIRLFTRWCKTFIPNADINVRVLAYPDVDRDSSIRYWSRITGIKQISFYRKPVILRSSKRRRILCKRGTVQIGIGKGAAEWQFKMMEWIRRIGGRF